MCIYTFLSSLYFHFRLVDKKRNPVFHLSPSAPLTLMKFLKIDAFPRKKKIIIITSIILYLTSASVKNFHSTQSFSRKFS